MRNSTLPRIISAATYMRHVTDPIIVPAMKTPFFVLYLIAMIEGIIKVSMNILPLSVTPSKKSFQMLYLKKMLKKRPSFLFSSISKTCKVHAIPVAVIIRLLTNTRRR